MSDADDYIANAAEIDKEANRATDLEIKALLRATATNWRRLAEYARRRGENGQGRGIPDLRSRVRKAGQ